MDLDELAQSLWRAAEQRYVCRISLNREPLPRLIHPYGIARTTRGRIVLVCWQAAGLTRAGAAAGYRNLDLQKVVEFEETDETFERREDFHPEAALMKDWVFAI